jgi:hypothetical protein
VDGLTTRTMAMAAPALLRWLAAARRSQPPVQLSAPPPRLNQHEARVSHCEGRAWTPPASCSPHRIRVP